MGVDGSDLERELAALRRERDLYRRLLALDVARDLQALFAGALEVLADLSRAAQAYLEIFPDDRLGLSEPICVAHGFAEKEIPSVRDRVSRGIIAEAIARRETVVTKSALLDPRFGANDSIVQNRIEAVLCTPLGTDPPRGVLYLQAPAACGALEASKDRVEELAVHLGQVAERLLRQKLREEPPALRAVRDRLRLDLVVGQSAALIAVLEQLALVAPLDIALLLTGDTGTGKSLLARVVHESGPRARAPLVEINCAALPDTLLESELFGAVAGAHSTATRAITGKVTAAEGGTLFLDEIGELSLTAQAKLLQLLNERLFYPLGSVTPVRANVRIIAAANTDLSREVAERRFRADLFYRLNVLPIRVPSLIERREDIAPLAEHFVRTASVRHGLPALELSPAALRAVELAEWPGNIRELAHHLEAALVRAAATAARRIELPHLFPGRAAEGSAEPLSFQEQTRQFQRDLLERMLRETNWNVPETARRLDLARSHIYHLIRAFGLARR